MKPLCVLIVDDEEDLVHTLVERLTLRGIDAHGVTTGREALERLETSTFNVVLLDVKMPQVGGLKVIKEIKERMPDLQVVLLTGHGSEQDAKEGKALGAYDYLIKPFNIESLIEVLRKAAREPIAGGS